MSTQNDSDAEQQQEQVNRQFLTAVYLGRQDDAAAIRAQVDWSRFTTNQNPMERVLNHALFVARTPAEHAKKNRELVANYAAENFNYGEHTYEDDQGWEHTSLSNGASADWRKTVYVRPSWAEEDDDEGSKSVTMRVDFAETKNPWDLDGCALVGCEVLDDSGNKYGSLPNFERAHKLAAYGVTADKMPDFARQVMQWCLDADRSDLVAVNASTLLNDVSLESRAKSALTQAYSGYILYRAAKLGQADVVETALSLGCNPLETLKISDGNDRTPLDFIEKLPGDASAMLIRSVMARRAATLALDEIAETKARLGP